MGEVPTLREAAPSEKAKLAGIEAAEKVADTPGWGLDGIPKAMIDAMCVAAIRAAYATDHPQWGGLPVAGAALREPRAPTVQTSNSAAYEIAREFNEMPPDAAPGAFQDLAYRLSQAVIHAPDHPDYERVCQDLDECEARLAALNERYLRAGSPQTGTPERTE